MDWHKLLSALASALKTIHHEAQASGLEGQAITTIKNTAESALSHLNAHSNGAVNAFAEIAAATALQASGNAVNFSGTANLSGKAGS